MEAPATPPRQTRRRAHSPQTPPSPTHGPVLEDREPYRRSSRRTLHSNPYSSANLGVLGSSSSQRSPISNRIPPLHSRTPSRKFSVSLSEALSTPPASPMQAPVERAPARAVDNCNGGDNTKAHGSSSLTIASQQNSSAMFPTPSKTPTLTPARKRQRATSMQDSARILRFQPEDPNDVMPNRHDSRKQKPAAAVINDDYDIGASDSGRKTKVEFSVYSEVHARVPEDDLSSANVFRASRGRGRGTVSEPELQQRAREWDSSPSPPPRSRKTAADQAAEAEMDLAVSRGEGMVYTFRGRKVFRKFDDVAADEDLGAGPRQQALKRAAGGPAARPITRSAIRPRLLWTVDGHEHDIRREISYTDEEAETDVEMSDRLAATSAAPVDEADWSVTFTAPSEMATPVKSKKARKPMLSPPTTARTTRQSRSNDIPSFQDTLDADDEAAPESVMPTPQRSSRKKKAATIGNITVFHDGADGGDDVGNPIPPTPARARTTRIQTHLTPIVEDSDEQGSAGAPTSPTVQQSKRKARSPFDNWPRRKRGSETVGEAADAAPTKRSRSGTRSGQA